MSSSNSHRIRIVCVSDTHNDDPTDHIPTGDVFIHAGDMTDNGTPEELKKTLDWIRKLPHKLKIVIAGNYDMGLDQSQYYNKTSHALFTSASARADGVVYLDNAEPQHLHDNLLNVYANPTQPDFLKLGYAFVYRPSPSPDATAAWASAPETSRGPLELWLSHGPPKGRLDNAGPPLNFFMKGCEAQRRKIAAAKPLVCVFGHFHYNRGVEVVTWRDGGDDVEAGNEVEASKIINVAEEQVHDFTGLKPGKETVFVNAAWMTALGPHIKRRNNPIVFDLEYAPSS